MTLRLGSVTTVVASSAEAAKQILQTHERTFSDRFVPEVVAAQPDPVATLAWAPGDNLWRNRRRVCNRELFNNQKLDELQHLRHKKAKELVSHIGKCAASGTQVDIGRVAFATALNLLSNTIFSIDMVDPDFETAQEFKDLVWRIMEDAGKPNLSDYFPVIKRFDLQGLKRHIKPSYMRLHEIFDEVIDERLQARKRNCVRTGDFLDVLLDLCEQDGSEFNRRTIKPLLVDLFIAGSDTSAITTEWAMAELLRNPKLLQKARKEIMDKIGANQQVKESNIDLLPYLQAIVKETLRLHPAAPLLLPYKSQSHCQIFNFTIPKNTQVLVNAWAIGRDPECWEDPSDFIPERFLNSNVDFRGRDFEYIPFGAGRRICPGLPLAVRMVHLMLASILQSFDWKIPEGVKPEDLDMEEQFGATMKKSIPLVAIPIVN